MKKDLTLPHVLYVAKFIYLKIYEIKNKNKEIIENQSSELGLTSIKQATKDSVRAIMLIRAYRIRGHLIANLDPLSLQKKNEHPELKPESYGFTEKDYQRKIFLDGVLGLQYANLTQILEILKKTYCSTIGYEFMHMGDPEEKAWIRDRIEGPEKNVTVKIFKGEQPMEVLNPKTNDWKKFFEPFGQSIYWKGPEFKVRADAGNYKIHVQSTEKSMRYVLATGEIEAFDGTESLRAILLIPELKKNFFEESPFSFILSPLGWGYILLLQILVILIGFVISKILNISRVKFQMKYFQFSIKNIMICGVFFWATILFFAIQTSWHPLLIMMSGLSLFIALISRRNLS